MKEQKFKIDEYVIDKMTHKIHKIINVFSTTNGNWIFKFSDGSAMFQEHLDKWEPKEGEYVISTVSINIGEYFKTYTVILKIKEKCKNKSEFIMSDNSILHITDIIPFTGDFLK